MSNLKKKPRSISTSNMTVAQLKELINKLKMDMTEQEDIYKEELVLKDAEILRLNKLNEQLQNTNQILATDEIKTKSILRLYAQGKSIGRIFDILTNTEGIDVTFELINNIVNKYESRSLDVELRDFCLKEKEIFAKENSFNDEEDRIRTIREMDSMMNTVSEVFSRISQGMKNSDSSESDIENLKEMFNAIKSFTDLATTKSKFTKGILNSSTNININTEDVGVYSNDKTDQFLQFDDDEDVSTLYKAIND